MIKKHFLEQGFTLVELITVLVILGVISSVVASRMMSQSTYQVQAGRDQLISAFFVAQQSAMNLNFRTQLTTSGTQIDIRVDRNSDTVFAASESLDYAGVQYPIDVEGGISLSSGQFLFDGLGHTSAGAVQVTKGSLTVPVTVSNTGYAY